MKEEDVNNGNSSNDSAQNSDEDVKERACVFDDDDACDKYLKTLDPKEWKNQDHYKVLGLSLMRIDATESDIKKSCMFRTMFFFYYMCDSISLFLPIDRKIVLRHHPDKRGQQQNVDLDYDYYSCITKGILLA